MKNENFFKFAKTDVAHATLNNVQRSCRQRGLSKLQLRVKMHFEFNQREREKKMQVDHVVFKIVCCRKTPSSIGLRTPSHENLHKRKVGFSQNLACLWIRLFSVDFDIEGIVSRKQFWFLMPVKSFADS